MKGHPVWRHLGVVMQCALGLLLLGWLLTWSNLDSGRLIQRLAQVSLPFLALGSFCFITAICLNALRYWLFLPPSIPIAYLVGVALIQNALLTFVPWRVGEVSYPLILRHDYSVSLARSSGVILIVRLTDLLIILAVILLGGARLGLDLSIAVILLGIIVLLMVSAFLVWIWRRDTIPSLLQNLISPVELVRRPIRFGTFALISVTVFAVTVLQTNLILRAAAFPLGPLDTALLNAFSLLAAVLPIHPPGGWGTIDSIQVVVLERLSYDSQTAIPAILIAHLLYTVLILTGGLAGWLLRGLGSAAPETTS